MLSVFHQQSSEFEITVPHVVRIEAAHDNVATVKDQECIGPTLVVLFILAVEGDKFRI